MSPPSVVEVQKLHAVVQVAQDKLRSPTGPVRRGRKWVNAGADHSTFAVPQQPHPGKGFLCHHSPVWITTYNYYTESCYNSSMPTDKIKAIIRLFRPDLSLAAGICVVAGQILAAGRLPSLVVGLAGFLCGFALSASAIILNDYFDYEVDLINAPERPLPSGAISRPEAIVLAVATAFSGLSAAFSSAFLP